MSHHGFDPFVEEVTEVLAIEEVETEVNSHVTDTPDVEIKINPTRHSRGNVSHAVCQATTPLTATSSSSYNKR